MAEDDLSNYAEGDDAEEPVEEGQEPEEAAAQEQTESATEGAPEDPYAELRGLSQEQLVERYAEVDQRNRQAWAAMHQEREQGREYRARLHQLIQVIHGAQANLAQQQQQQQPQQPPNPEEDIAGYIRHEIEQASQRAAQPIRDLLAEQQATQEHQSYALADRDSFVAKYPGVDLEGAIRFVGARAGESARQEVLAQFPAAPDHAIDQVTRMLAERKIRDTVELARRSNRSFAEVAVALAQQYGWQQAVANGAEAPAPNQNGVNRVRQTARGANPQPGHRSPNQSLRPDQLGQIANLSDDDWEKQIEKWKTEYNLSDDAVVKMVLQANSQG